MFTGYPYLTVDSPWTSTIPFDGVPIGALLIVLLAVTSIAVVGLGVSAARQRRRGIGAAAVAPAGSTPAPSARAEQGWDEPTLVAVSRAAS